MIYPFVVGPFALLGITYFQAESNSYEPAMYGCIFPALVRQWKKDFTGKSAGGGSPPWFGFVLMEPWVTTANIALLRDSQLQAMSIPGVGYGSAQDIGDPLGPWGSVHPRHKQVVGARLAAAAMNQIYGVTAQGWTGPSFKSASGSVAAGNMVVTVSLNGLGGQPAQLLTPTDDEACPVSLGVPASICAWPQVQASTGAWVNATLSLASGGTELVFTAPQPASGNARPVMVSYGYGVWPANYVQSSYTVDTGYETVAFPLLPFNETVTPA
jgi:hypothetical protein